MKRVFIFFFVGMLIIFQPMKVYADAGTVAIAGGSIATGGLSAAALGSLTGPAVVIVFTALLAAGMNVRLSQAAEAEGMTKTEFVRSKIQSYCSAAHKTLADFYGAVLTGTEIAANGAISLSETAGNQIRQFGNWLFSSNQVDSSSGSISGDSISLGGYTLPISNTLTVVAQSGNTFTFTASQPVAWFLGRYSTQSNRINVCCVSNSSFTVNVSPSYGTYTANTVPTQSNPFYGISWEHFYDNQSYSLSLPYVNGQWQQFINALDGVWNPGMTAPDDTMTGSETDWTQNRDKIGNPGNILNPGLNPGLDIPRDTSISISIPDYLNGLLDVIDGVRNPAIPGVDDATGTPVTTPIDPTRVQDPTLDPAPTIPPVMTPVLDPDVPADPEIAIPPLTMQLKGVFPFCIPFDVVDMLKLLKTDPVAPTYTVNWNIPIINQNLSFTIDLSPFNTVASILRTMELIAFCIGLAFVTRSMFIRG